MQGQLPAVTGVTAAGAALSADLALMRRSRVVATWEASHRETVGPRAVVRLFPDCPPPGPPGLQPPPAPLGEAPARAVSPPPGPLPTVTPPPSPLAAGLPFPTQDSLALTPTLLHVVTRVDTLDARVSVQSSWRSTGLILVSAVPRIGWSHVVDRHTSLRGGVGLAYSQVARQAYQTCSAPLAELASRRVDPIADIAMSTIVYQGRSLLLTSDLGAAAAWYFDPVTGRAGPVGNVVVHLAARLPPHWSFRFEAFFSTSLAARPIAGNPDETSFSSALPIHYDFSPFVWAELGGRWSDRAPHLEADDFAFHRRALWVYASVGGTFTTAPPPSRPGRPG